MSLNLDWCIIRLGDDLNWWVEEISDDIHWDVDGLSVIDPRQITHIVDLCTPFQQYGFGTDVINRAFYTFHIEKELSSKRVRLVQVNESIVDCDDQHFALPDIMDEEKGPYADFLDQITMMRVKMLNDMIEFAENLTIEELEEEIRERQNMDYIKGRAVHCFNELTVILEYVPAGYELDMEEEDHTLAPTGEEDYSEITPVESGGENIREEDSLTWDENDSEGENKTEEFEMETEVIKPRRGRPPKN